MKIDDALLRQARAQGARTGRTLNAIVEDALRQSLARRTPEDQAPPVELPTFTEGHLQAGVDLDDGAALLELMERVEP